MIPAGFLETSKQRDLLLFQDFKIQERTDKNEKMAKCVEKVANKKAIEYCWSKAQLIKNEPSIECPCNTENIEKEK